MNILTDEEILAAMTPEAVEGDWYLPQTFARAIEAAVLAKLAAQDLTPHAWDSKSMGLTFENHYSDTKPLYTETTLLAAQQRTAEACAKVCENLPHKFRSEFSNVSSECAEAIRKGKWRDN